MKDSLLKGHIGYTTDGVYDGRDYYKTLQPADGTIKLMVAGTQYRQQQWLPAGVCVRPEPQGIAEPESLPIERI